MSGLDALGMLQSQGQALKIIGGIPILKNLLGHTLEKLKLPKHLDIGNIPNILAAVQAGNIGSLLQSPLGSALGSLTGSISSAQAALTSALGGGASSMTTALGSLSTSASSLSALADNLVGVTNTAGLANQLDLVSHMSLAQGLGDALPSALSLATVTAPITSSALLASVQTQVQSLASQVLGSTMTVSAGTTAIAALQASVDAVTTGSTGAISTLASAAPALSAAASAIALLAAGPPELQAAMQATIRPDMLATVQAIITAHIDDLTTAAAPAPESSD